MFDSCLKKTINVFGKFNDYTLLRGRLNSIKKDDSYENGNCSVLTKAKVLLHEDDLKTRLTVHHH